LGALNVIDENDPLWTEIATNLADVYRKKGLYSESRDLYMRALKKLESKHGDMHSEIAEVCNALGMLEKKEGNYVEAIKCYKNALKIGAHLFGKKIILVLEYISQILEIFIVRKEISRRQRQYIIRPWKSSNML